MTIYLMVDQKLVVIINKLRVGHGLKLTLVNAWAVFLTVVTQLLTPQILQVMKTKGHPFFWILTYKV